MIKDNAFMQPQEIEAWYVLPAIRRELAISLKQEGLDQKKIAKLLGVTGAAVSQYMNKKRGCDCKVRSSLKKEFKESAKKLIKNNDLVFLEIQRLLKLLRNDGAVCKLHIQKCNVPGGCTACFK